MIFRSKDIDSKMSIDINIDNPIELFGSKLFHSNIKWIEDSDSITGVLLELDYNLLKNDEKYMDMFFNDLLDQERVEAFCQRESVNIQNQELSLPYIGGVIKKDNNYAIIFNQNILKNLGECEINFI